jgi:putative protease
MGLLMQDLPPLPLHASTQCDNRSPERIKFMEQCGFSQLILARELSLDEIRKVALQTSVRLEVFVHGALCVSYSGQCYISEACCGRSANRGECAQFCRLPYSLQDAGGKTIIANRHLLSLKDLNRSAQLESLLDVGVSSFKIEGRLKDITYVKNITAYYRQKLDSIIEKRKTCRQASSGKCFHTFAPDPAKSFNRGFSTYFLTGRTADIASFDTPKSIGEFIGTVCDVQNEYFSVSGNAELHNGDGLCFFTPSGEFWGSRVNRTENNRIFLHDPPMRLSAGTRVFRNADRLFEKSLSGKSAVRKIFATCSLSENRNGFTLEACDEDNTHVSLNLALAKHPAQKPQQEYVRQQLCKTGNTDFSFTHASITWTQEWFISASILTEWRRQLTDLLETARRITRNIEIGRKPLQVPPFPETSLSYLGNVTNQHARLFYQRAGVNDISPAFSVQHDIEQDIMFTKHCIKYSMGWCTKQNGEKKFPYREPLYLVHNKQKFRLIFDCARCEMRISTHVPHQK